MIVCMYQIFFCFCFETFTGMGFWGTTVQMNKEEIGRGKPVQAYVMVSSDW